MTNNWFNLEMLETFMPLLVIGGRKQSDIMGTSFLIEYNKKYYLITANHVLDRLLQSVLIKFYSFIPFIKYL